MKLRDIAVLLIALGVCAVARAREPSRVGSRLQDGIWRMTRTTCANGTQLAPGVAEILSTMTLEFSRNRVIQRARTRVCEGTVISHYRIEKRKLIFRDGYEVINCHGQIHRGFIARKMDDFRLADGILTISEYDRRDLCQYGGHDIVYRFRKTRGR